MKSLENLLILLQLVSPGLPVGAYNYSEGLETLIAQKVINTSDDLYSWLKAEMQYGAITVETSIIVRVYDNLSQGNFIELNYWNQWLSAIRETPELREQNWQMGQSLLKLVLNFKPEMGKIFSELHSPYNFTVIWAIALHLWEIDIKTAIISYLHSWTANLVNSGVKLIPLGQTSGQNILFELNKIILPTAEKILHLENEQLNSCNWGLALASMNHETLYSRLCRS